MEGDRSSIHHRIEDSDRNIHPIVGLAKLEAQRRLLVSWETCGDRGIGNEVWESPVRKRVDARP